MLGAGGHAPDQCSYVDSWAVGLKGFGNPVMLDVFHEMDGNWYPWGYGVNGNSPADLIAAYRHVHDRFVLAAATNVQFVWNVNVWNYSGVDQWGSVEPIAGDPPGVRKGSWITGAARSPATQFSRISTVVWFSQKGTPFALDSSSNSISGARTAFGGCP